MTGSPEGGAIAFPQADAIWREVFICDMGEGLGTGILVSEPSALSPEPQSRLSHMTLAHSALPPLELRMSDCK